MDQEALTIPNHIGFIMDGNRRWATAHSIPEMDGHLSGYNAMKEVLTAAYDAGIKYVTLYAFSSENWNRKNEEVTKLMGLAISAVATDLKFLIEKEVKVVFLGRRDGLSDKVLASLKKAEAATASLARATLAVCFNYGGRQEIIDAVQACIADGLTAEDITEDAISAHMYHPEIPPLDMIVRTSGEQRLSNFMLWRADYSELYFLKKYWPDMTKEDVADSIVEYNKRKRRYGV
ncbi:MAG TPA: polyprenyl diphosphate synthase [Candidatus Saccharimonadales bacterium]|nr:polyprenyl diphosphate synthase [Candidatus Saccharimonadales bacterium]